MLMEGVLCPLVNRFINDDECFLTATVIEGITPKVDAVEGALECQNAEEICLNCENHPQ